MKIIITAICPKGEKITREVLSEQQAFAVISRLATEGCKDFGMKYDDRKASMEE